jgi:ABC-type bacteriocin/lantibiotic exporter with double-glycine peptidase domain
VDKRQRLALARVFLQRHAELIVLDEATSALDNAVEARVIEELHRHARAHGRTVVMVAHRLTTLRRTDRVLVMEAGQVVQDGSFDDLAATHGVFQTLLHATDTDRERISKTDGSAT